MNLKRAIFLLSLFPGIALQQLYSQVFYDLEPVINEYTSVSAIYRDVSNDVDSVDVASAAAFSVGDTVMLYCAKGATIGTMHDSTYLPGNPFYPAGEDAQNPGNTGRYAFVIIQEINGNTVVFNASISSLFRSLDAGEVAQLIRVPSYRNARVTPSGLRADDWDPATGTGGVVALFVHGVLRLDGDIDVSGAGLKGAAGSTDVIYTAGCSSTDTLLYYEPFYLDAEVQAGLKGEGITDTQFLYNRGKASSINGGGGGNGLLAGGGGGSNRTAGASGGSESSECSPGVLTTGGEGGFELGRPGHYYNNDDAAIANRILFGGGGGSGTRVAGGTTTDGGNGGGIVVIVADSIDGNAGQILADGNDVSALAVDGAGAGGGGGGCIILEVAGYQSTLYLSARGGNGGNSSSTGSDTVGMGGAGGGGIYWIARDSSLLSPNYDPGSNGTFLSSPPYDPLQAPGPARKYPGLEAPLVGFLFNPVPSEFTVCSDQDPEPIIASSPKGGDQVYSYQWIDSSKNQNYWDIAPGLSTQQSYDPGPLSDTTYYRRVVSSAGGTIVDTSFRIAVYVHPAITGNIVAANDTVCSGNSPELFVSAATIGGGPTGGTFNYKWQELPDGDVDYTDLNIINSDPTYQEGPLSTSANYRRIAYAGVCIDTSNVERVRVLEPLSGNNITPFDTICVNTAPDLISGPAPSDGDQDDIRYQWLYSTDPAQMGTLVPGETSIDYQSPPLDQTAYFRRVVLSGNDNACTDTSAYVEILNIPAITGNTIAASQTLCQEDRAEALFGTSPGGGYQSQYSYTWISSTDQSTWVPATGEGGNDMATNFEPGVMSGDTTWYSRVVGSGGQELACRDTSESIVINVIPSITNNLLTPLDDLKCQQDMPEAINGSLPGGGATVGGNDPTVAYRWEVARVEGMPGAGDWVHPATGANDRDYTDPDQLISDVDRWYRRIVNSGLAGECVSVSDTVHLVVHSEITANEIDAAQRICFNDSQPLREIILAGGENTISPVYTWRRWLDGQSSGDGVDLPGSDFPEFEDVPYTNPAQLIYHYERVVEIGACLDTSNAMQVTVMQLPGGRLTDEDLDVCEQATVLHLDLNMDGLTPGHFVTPWEVYLKDGVNPELIGPSSVDQDPDTLGIVLVTDGADHVSYTYEIESIRYYPEEDEYACISSPADLPASPVAIEVSRKPEPQITADEMVGETYELCNTTAPLVMDPDNGTLSYWSEPAGSVFFSPGSGPDEYNVSIPNNPDDFGQYRIFIRSDVGDCAGLDSIDLTFFEQPQPAYAGRDTFLFLNNQVQLRADPPTAGTGTWTLTNGTGSLEDEHDPNTMAYDLGMGEENTFNWTVTNGENEGLCISSSDVTVILRNEVKRYNGFSPNGDMLNEYYIIQGLVYADEFSITFMNSLGNNIRTITDENYSELEAQIDESLIANGLAEDEMVVWDGRAENGNLVPPGTYYFVLTFIMHERDYLTGEVIRKVPYEFKDYVVVAGE